MNFNSKNIYHKNKKEERDQEVRKQIEDTFKIHPAYGHRRLALELKMNKKKILRVMKKYHLKPPRLWYQRKYLTKPNLKYQNQFNNLIREVKFPQENEIWATDLTYLKFKEEFVYLSVIQDISNNEVLSCNLGDKHNSDLVLRAIRQAIKKQKQPPRIFHSDRGKENLNENCIQFLKDHQVQISVSDPGSPWQNGHPESFFSRLKGEAGDLNRFEDLGGLTEYIYHYINYYNNDRIITKLKTSPIKYRNQLKNQRICS